MARPSLLACFAHPDDEAFSCGGTIAAATATGATVSVVCATRGEAGTSQVDLQGDDLGRRRVAELRESCRILGAEAPTVLDLPDGQLADQAAVLEARIGDCLRAMSVDVVLTMGRDGAYGHPDHVACSVALSRAVAALVKPPTVLHVAFPAGLFDELRRRLRRAALPLEPVPPDGASPDYAVRTRDFASHKLDSLAAHRSQLIDGNARNFLLPGLMGALLEEELFQHVAGPAPRGFWSRLFTQR